MANEGMVQAAKDVKGAANLARLLDVYPSAISQMLRGDMDVPPKRAVQIEQIPEVTIDRTHLRPHDWWLIWPELAEKYPERLPTENAA